MNLNAIVSLEMQQEIYCVFTVILKFSDKYDFYIRPVFLTVNAHTVLKNPSVTQAQYIVTELSVNHIDRSENPSSICRVD
jgi:hypothetical protein